MYTRCPNCETYFKISAEQLKKAGGKVRCGQCSKVFNSLGNLLEELPVALADRGKSKPPAPAPAPKPAAPQAKPTVAPPPPPKPPPPKPRPAPAVPTPTPPPAAAPSKAPPAPKPEPVTPAKQKQPVSDDAIVFDGGDEQPLILSDDTRDTLDLSSEDKIENVQAGPFSSMRDLVPYPGAADEDNEPYSSGVGNLFWGSGVALLLLLFIFQYSYYMRDDLARYPELRPWIQTLCEIAQCELPLQQNIDLIKLTNRDITSHPRVKGALLINAVIVNNATFAQPFPAMQITLSDINGSVIAKRRFQPTEYLDADMNLRRGMPPNSPIQIGLEISDPGKDAVNFEFNFFYPTS